MRCSAGPALHPVRGVHVPWLPRIVAKVPLGWVEKNSSGRVEDVNRRKKKKSYLGLENVLGDWAKALELIRAPRMPDEFLELPRIGKLLPTNARIISKVSKVRWTKELGKRMTYHDLRHLASGRRSRRKTGFCWAVQTGDAP